MQIFINDRAVECADNATLSATLSASGITPINIAVAIDNTVVPKPQWDTTVLQDGARILIIKAVQGG